MILVYLVAELKWNRIVEVHEAVCCLPGAPLGVRTDGHVVALTHMRHVGFSTQQSPRYSPRAHVCLSVISLRSPAVWPGSLRRMRSAQCHGWISRPLASQKKRVAVQRRSRLGDTPHNYVVKRQNEQGNLFNSIIYESEGWERVVEGSKCVSWPFFFKRH